MRIAVSGCPHQHKSEYIESFVKAWPSYKVVEPSLEQWAAANAVTLGDKMTASDVEKIFDYYGDILTKSDKTENVIIKGSPMDLVVRTIYNKEVLGANYSTDLINKIIFGCKNMYKLIDVVFWFPLTRAAANFEVTPEDSNLDSFYKALNVAYQQHSDSFFPVLDSAALVEIYGVTPDIRISMTRMYLNEQGEIHAEDKSLLSETLESLQTELQTPNILMPEDIKNAKTKKKHK